MPTVSVRISEEEKKRLQEIGPIAKSVREAIKFYLNTRKTKQLMSRPEELQNRNSVKTTTADVALMIAEGRRSH